ncbi:hypothetical protein K438DRAFT_939883 [Mycena galopus ATCC 62051]|nr:hypothetical protein K438DRAFT_939883 [Mycena galopus ATCC 62051]
MPRRYSGLFPDVLKNMRTDDLEHGRAHERAPPLGQSLYARLRPRPAVTLKPFAVDVDVLTLAEKHAAAPQTPTSEDESSDADTELSQSTASISGDDEPTATTACAASVLTANPHLAG